MLPGHTLRLERCAAPAKVPLIQLALALAACSSAPGNGASPDAGGAQVDAAAPPPDAPAPDAPALPGVVVDLRADVDRDGTLGPADDDGEEAWTAARGAVFLANLDDDLERCPREMYPAVTPDDTLAACHDAADGIVNGDADALDLARLAIVPWPEAPADVVAAIRVSPAAARARTRIFRRAGAGFTRLDEGAAIPAADLRAGLELAIEATDVVRDPQTWDGLADVALEVRLPGRADEPRRDVVRLKVAPFILSHHGSPAETIHVTALVDAARPEEEAASVAFRAALEDAIAAAGVTGPLTSHAMRDRWMQDLFETGYMAMPAPGGGQQTMRVLLRSPFLRDPESPIPLRIESRLVFFLRGKDRAVIQQYDRAHALNMRTLDSMGNTETIPPYEKDRVRYPLGRVLRGSVPDYHPDPSFATMLAAQGVQPVVHIDTSWLMVAHVDETIAFLPADTARGWIALVNDPARAREMLLALERAGHGDARLFAGKETRAGASAETTVSAVLADVDLMTQSAIAAAEVDAQLAILRAETGLGDDELVRVPFLHHETNDRSAAYQPGAVNLLALSPTLVLAPDPLGPIIDGEDVFKAQLEEELGRFGIAVRWVDVWDLLHRHVGEVHCGTNAERVIPATPWWEVVR